MTDHRGWLLNRLIPELEQIQVQGRRVKSGKAMGRSSMTYPSHGWCSAHTRSAFTAGVFQSLAWELQPEPAREPHQVLAGWPLQQEQPPRAFSLEGAEAQVSPAGPPCLPPFHRK